MLSATPDAEPTLTVEEDVVEGGAWSTAAVVLLLEEPCDARSVSGRGHVLPCIAWFMEPPLGCR